MTPILRDGCPEDAAALAAILGGWIEATPWMPRLHGPADHLAFLAGLVAGGGVRVAEVNAQAVGFLARDGARVGAFYLAAAARGQGIGTALLREAQARAATLDLWTFQANAGAQRFYRRHGFVEVERSDGSGNDEGLPDLRLIWRRPQ